MPFGTDLKIGDRTKKKFKWFQIIMKSQSKQFVYFSGFYTNTDAEPNNSIQPCNTAIYWMSSGCDVYKGIFDDRRPNFCPFYSANKQLLLSICIFRYIYIEFAVANHSPHLLNSSFALAIRLIFLARIELDLYFSCSQSFIWTWCNVLVFNQQNKSDWEW